MKNIHKQILGISLLLLVLAFPSCTNDLNQSPDNGDSVAGETFYSTPESYKQNLAKLYAGFATSGQQGPAGKPDISGIDEGTSQYIRGYWMMQELTTDEAVIGWNDGTIKDFHAQSWTSSDNFISATFARFSFQIVNCNEFLRQTTDEKLAARGVDATLKGEIATYRAEARFLRAITYWHLIDTFGGGSLATEESPTTFYYPEYASRAEIYKFIDDELTAIAPVLKAPKSNEAYRVDQAAAWMLQAKLYMNAKVYIGTDHYAEAVPLINKVLATSYKLHTNYNQLFLADNNKNGAQNEFIFTIGFDGIHTQTYGGTTFLTHAPVGGSMKAADFGINGGWAGIRTTAAFVDKFGANTTDSRGQFYTDGQTKEIKDISLFTDGYAIQKFRNVDVNGLQGSDKAGNFSDADFPIFRLGDAYLMYAECAVRAAGGATLGNAVTYVNALRTRAKATTVSQGDLTLDFILDERARELHWEGHRRTDLVRFGKFTGGAYLWPFKGGAAGGSPTQSYRDVFPIPAYALASNQKLQQNPGY
ncbi:RagB/SusD family nutrient uptake outer membrane protein [Flavobacterium muglaense]|uniref:RagB/SusD family nutrient uptake outer membrane protein n=1 Tax=Flavobacterium muglaense TaxID=2764716 RepID=A0A923MYE6_9FLAO|nr:RagB/SusD family nutrient uptake outer membrane protein [Flavobacterium muglaense]MBC5836891.1 RagB/SusD family nutrient uptake outer membrane protein [Flavobacterium muglaense]MBC5843420.1 RagB/SusD family nutrient uptake outer membrane protein [Flavobacterium muglaense]